MNSGDTSAARILVRGLVQGVGFRYFAAHAAEANGVVGYVRNVEDGSVEIWGEGSPPGLDRFITEIVGGPRHAVVTHWERIDASPTNRYRDFRILR